MPSGTGYWLASGPTFARPKSGALSYGGLVNSLGNVGTVLSGSSCSGERGLNAPINGIAAKG